MNYLGCKRWGNQNNSISTPNFVHSQLILSWFILLGLYPLLKYWNSLIPGNKQSLTGTKSYPLRPKAIAGAAKLDASAELVLDALLDLTIPHAVQTLLLTTNNAFSLPVNLLWDSVTLSPYFYSLLSHPESCHSSGPTEKGTLLFTSLGNFIHLAQIY